MQVEVTPSVAPAMRLIGVVAASHPEEEEVHQLTPVVEDAGEQVDMEIAVPALAKWGPRPLLKQELIRMQMHRAKAKALLFKSVQS